MAKQEKEDQEISFCLRCTLPDCMPQSKDCPIIQKRRQEDRERYKRKCKEYSEKKRKENMPPDVYERKRIRDKEYYDKNRKKICEQKRNQYKKAMGE